MTWVNAIAGWLGQHVVDGVGWLVAVGVALWAGRKAQQANKLAQAANEHADGANRIAEEALQVSRRADELAQHQHHDRMRPGPIPEINMDRREFPNLPGQAGLFGTITLPRDYRVVIDAVGSSTHRLGVSLFVRGGQELSFEIERWPEGKKAADTKALLMRFWPPAETDPTDGWTCPCGRPTDADDNGPGHWETAVPVRYYDVLDSVF